MFAQEQIDRFLDSIDPSFRAGGPDVADEEAHARYVASLHAIFEAVGRGDFDAIGAVCHEDVTMEIAGTAAIPFIGTWHGRDEVVESIRRNFNMLESQRPEIQSLAAQDHHVVVILRERGRYVATGVDYCVRAAQVFTFEDGKIRRIREIVVDEPPAVA